MVTIRSFYSTYLGLVITNDLEPHLDKIARDHNPKEMTLLLQLVLRCAVTGTNKTKHIRTILDLEPKLKTSLLIDIKSMGLEVTLLQLEQSLLGEISDEDAAVDEYEDLEQYKEDNEDSGMTSGEELNGSILSGRKADFGCQHQAYLETSFDDEDYEQMRNTEQDTTMTGSSISRVLGSSGALLSGSRCLESPDMQDFGCQFDSRQLTSEVVDIDEGIEDVITMKEPAIHHRDNWTTPIVVELVDCSTDPMCVSMVDGSNDPIVGSMVDGSTDPMPVNSVDSSNDPMFGKMEQQDMSTDPYLNDAETIEILEEKVVALEELVLEMIGKDACVEELEKRVGRMHKMLLVGDTRYRKALLDTEAVKLALRMSCEEGENLRISIQIMEKDKEGGENRAKLMTATVAGLLRKNADLMDKNDVLRQRLENLEDGLRLRNERDETSLEVSNGINQKLNGMVSDADLSHFSDDMDNVDPIRQSSRCSSGIGSSIGTKRGTRGYKHKGSEKSPLTKSLDHEAELERLNELVGVMEVREEQLVGEAGRLNKDREEAVQEAKEADRRLEVASGKKSYSDKVKNVLLLTAAFGAVHSSIGSEIAASCFPL